MGRLRVGTKSSDVINSVWQSLIAECKRRGLRQVDLAEIAGVTRQYISAVNTRKDNISMHALYALADAVDMELRIRLVPKGEKAKMCSCGKNFALEPHTCPYREEIDGDDQTLCTCCTDCQNECCADV